MIALIPVKSFHNAKSRLGEAVSADARVALSRSLAEHTAGTADEAGARPVIVTRDTKVSSWAKARGLEAVIDEGAGLNSAAVIAVQWALARTSEWIFLHGDLPLVHHSDLSPLLAAASSGADAIAPSSDGGTSAITSRRLIDFRFGPGSFARHLAQLEDPTISTRLGLLHDLDTPQDLASAADHPRGRWLRSVL